MKLTLILTGLMALAGAQPTLSFADTHCTCSKTCMENCQKGKTEGCTCQSCDCAKTGKCSEGHCKRPEKEEKK